RTRASLRSSSSSKSSDAKRSTKETREDRSMGLAKVWVFAEADDDKPASSTLELLTKAREVADAVECVYVGTNADALAPALGEYGVGKVHAVDGGEVLAGVTGAAAMAALVDEHQPDLILFAQTYDGRDAVARLSVKLDRPVLTNGVSIAVDGDRVTVDGDADAVRQHGPVE